MKTLQHQRFVLSILLLVLAAGCQRIPMHERGAGIYLRISVDQSLDPAMTALLDFDARPSQRYIVVGKKPELVRVCFYDAEPEVLVTELSRISESWILEIEDIVGAAHIQKAEVYVTGQAAGRFLWDGRTTNHPCALGIETEIDIQRRRLFSVFNTFGKYPQPDCDVMVYVLVTTNSNAHCLYVYDVTDQWLNPDNSAHLIRIRDRMEIPGDDYHGNDFNPVVTDWDGVEIPVLIGY